MHLPFRPTPRVIPRALGPTLDARSAARLLGVSERTVLRWAAAGKIQSVKIGGTVRILTKPLLHLLNGEAIR